MAIYLVGNGNDTWDFFQAYENAQNGDTIEFEKGFCLGPFENNFIWIKKSLILEGHVEKGNNGNVFYNSIKTKINIDNNCNVTIKNLHFNSQNDTNLLNIKNSSNITLENLLIEKECDGRKYPELYLENIDNLTLEGIAFLKRNGLDDTISIKNSRGVIKNQNSSCGISITSDCDIDIDNCYFMAESTNVLNIKKSFVRIKDSTIVGETAELNFPAIWCEKSIVEMENSKVEQANYDYSVNLSLNSKLTSINNIITSINLNDSRVIMERSLTKEIIMASGASFVNMRNLNEFAGDRDSVVDILITGETVIKADNLIFNRIAAPNIRLGGSSYLKLFYYNVNGINDEIEVECNDSAVIDLPNKSKLQTNDAEADENTSGNNENSDEESDVNELEKIDNLIGLNSVKAEIHKMISMVEFNRKRKEMGMKTENQTLHSVFLGNPGTGKTTVARLIGKALYDYGALSGEEFKLVEVSESDLISSNVGGTAEQTKRILESAKGGVLFIDEAYTLNKGNANVNFGQEAINTILKYMEDHRDEIMIIFAGYTKEMEQFLETNPGLKSRVPNKFLFEDYSCDEIVAMGEKNLAEKEYRLEDSEYYHKKVSSAYENSLEKSNGRWIRNFNEMLTKALATRVIEECDDDVATIKNADIDSVLNKGRYVNEDGKDRDAMEVLDGLIGIESVKHKVKEFISLAEMNKRREEAGLENSDFTLHSMFLGNPGTGKTTVARILGDLLYQKDIIKQKKYIEVSRSDLVGGYVGHTALKTREVLQSALGGVLFIDEAYSLYSGSGNDFGKEAVDEILKFMEDHRRDIVIIFAGYTKEMADFIEMNSGLKSRIPNVFDFDDYTEDEIVEIGLLGLKKSSYEVDEDVYREVVINNYGKSNDNSNGRWIRNLNEDIIRAMSSRISKDPNADLNLITKADLLYVRR